MEGTILANASAKDRPASDFYPTPHDVTQALLDYMQFPNDTIFWECACGQGHMSKVLESNGYKTISTDLYSGEYGESNVDFTTQTESRGATFIITNPPFNVSERFIETAANMPGIKGFALLLKSQYWHSKKRAVLFEKYPPSWVLPLTWRPDFLFGQKGGAPTMECIWTIWDVPFSGVTFYKPLKR